MNSLETPGTSIDSLFERLEVYGKTTFEYSKLKLLETVVIVVNMLLPRLSVVLVLSMFVLVLNIGIALFLGELLGKSYYGFFIVAGFYLLAGLILHLFLHKWIKKPLGDLIIKQALQ
jgi:membrane-associated HD superfamily phosphohydrolase